VQRAKRADLLFVRLVGFFPRWGGKGKEREKKIKKKSPLPKDILAVLCSHHCELIGGDQCGSPAGGGEEKNEILEKKGQQGPGGGTVERLVSTADAVMKEREKRLEKERHQDEKNVLMRDFIEPLKKREKRKKAWEWCGSDICILSAIGGWGRKGRNGKKGKKRGGREKHAGSPSSPFFFAVLAPEPGKGKGKEKGAIVGGGNRRNDRRGGPKPALFYYYLSSRPGRKREGKGKPEKRNRQTAPSLTMFKKERKREGKRRPNTNLPIFFPEKKEGEGRKKDPIPATAKRREGKKETTVRQPIIDDDFFGGGRKGREGVRIPALVVRLLSRQAKRGGEKRSQRSQRTVIGFVLGKE